MIVIPRSRDGLLLVRQPDHAATSAQVVAAWRRPTVVAASLWSRIVAAAQHHDDGWLVAEQQPTLDRTGRPCDFMSLPLAEHLAVWQRGVASQEKRDPLAALLVAMHARWLYTHVAVERTPEETAVTLAFVEQLTQWIAARLQALAAQDGADAALVQPKALAAAQQVLTWADCLSLTLLDAVGCERCTGPVACADGQVTLTLTRDGQQVGIKPWPFRPPQVDLTTAAVQVQRTRFDDWRQLLATMTAQRHFELRWTLQPA